MVHIPHSVLHAVQHTATHLAREHDGPKGAIGAAGAGTALLLTAATVVSAPVSVPVIATVAGISAIAGWFGVFKDH